MADTELVKRCEQIQKDNIQKAIEKFFNEHPNLTKKEFGEVFGIEERSAGRYLDGNSTPQGKYYLALCEYMNISPNQLFGYNENEKLINHEHETLLKLYDNNKDFKKIVDTLIETYKNNS